MYHTIDINLTCIFNCLNKNLKEVKETKKKNWHTSVIYIRFNFEGKLDFRIIKYTLIEIVTFQGILGCLVFIS